MFPFLAVLICTMGSLILLLVVIARQARLQAAQIARDAAKEAAEEAVEKQEDLKAQREMARWRIGQLKDSLRETESQLADARLALGHTEDHARRLADQLAQLQAAVGELDRLGNQSSQVRSELEAELAQIRARLAEAGRRLAEAQQATAERRNSYAVVPYEGPHGTRRRPIYIECRAEAVVLQPEGVVFDADDFAGPLGSGNSLDVALRAVREYLLRHQGFDREETGEPYPLLLVRPEGIEAYYAARAAMRSWASDFGYELIGDDWQLEFPPPDPQLAAEVAQAVATARLRQQRLIAASPSLSGRKSPAGFVVSPHRGGLVPRGGSSDDDASAYKPQRPFGRLGNQYASWDDRHEGRGSGPEALGDAPGTTEPEQTAPPSGTGE